MCYRLLLGTLWGVVQERNNNRHMNKLAVKQCVTGEQIKLLGTLWGVVQERNNNRHVNKLAVKQCV